MRSSSIWPSAARSCSTPSNVRSQLILSDGTTYATAGPGESSTTRFLEELVIPLDPNTIFPPTDLARGLTEKTIASCAPTSRTRTRRKESPHNEVMAIHAKFSIPAACLVFARDRPGARTPRRSRRQARRLRRRHRRHLRLLHRDVSRRVAGQRPSDSGRVRALGPQPPARPFRHRRARSGAHDMRKAGFPSAVALSQLRAAGLGPPTTTPVTTASTAAARRNRHASGRRARRARSTPATPRGRA